MDKNKRIIIMSAVAAIVALVIGGVYYNAKMRDDAMLVVAGSEAVEPEATEMPESPPPPETIFVHIVGEVNKPGVYELPKGSRIVNVVDMAGGLTPDAVDGVNLARMLSDGEQIVIAKAGEEEETPDEQPAEPSGDASGATVNINTASKAELMTLPGVGDKLADAIIRYREKNGGFGVKDEIKEVPRIGEKLYMELEDLISVD